MPTFTTPIGTQADDLETVGGKGRSLARMARAGFNVPGGFLVATAAYRRFVAAHGLQERIVSLARPAVDAKTRAVSFEQASADIRALFAEHAIDAETAAEIQAEYAALPGAPAVAVRSSATAEDLPELSFAGQQDTFVNVHRRATHVLDAVRRTAGRLSGRAQRDQLSPRGWGSTTAPWPWASSCSVMMPMPTFPAFSSPPTPPLGIGRSSSSTRASAWAKPSWGVT